MPPLTPLVTHDVTNQPPPLSGYDVSRALHKGARAVQVGSAVVTEGAINGSGP